MNTREVLKLNRMARISKKILNSGMNLCEDFFLNISDSSVRNRKLRLSNLKNRYYGKRCFIMGNGPSLNKMNLNFLQDEFVWGSNRCYLLYNKINWRHSFYCAVDTRVVPDNAEEINSLISTQIETLFFFPLRFRKQNIIRSAKNVCWYNEFDIPDLDRNEKISICDVFTHDASERVASVTTVTIAALQLAVHLGFNPIYLIGCDTSYKIPSTINYENDDPYLLISTKDDDENHFDSTYFGKKSKWHSPNPELMIKHYEYAKKYCDSQKIHVINATLGGDLETFPRVDYYSLFD
jgi:hypothetical protein